MPLFQRWFGKQKFRRLADSFTLTDSNKQATLCQWIRQQADAGDTVIVLCHFQSSFLQNQQAIQAAEIDFEILADPVDELNLANRIRTEFRGKVVLTMAAMLNQSPDTTRLNNDLAYREKNDNQPSVAVIVTERYPITSQDDMIESFFHQTQLPVAIGYVISFEDPMLRHLLGERFIALLKQLGLGSNDLISSTMTNKELSRQLVQATRSVENETVATSPEEWIELNLKQQER